jgi:methionine-rich copper-binding protein CopC
LPTRASNRIRHLLLLGVLRVSVVSVALLLAMASPAAAHTELTATVPSDGQRVATPPAAVELVFTSTLQREFADVVVSVVSADRNGAGDSDGERLDLPAPEVAGATLRQQLPNSLVAGRYVVGYRVVAADGHPVTGQFSFTYAPTAQSPGGTIPAAAPPPTFSGQSGDAEGTGDGASSWAWGWLAGVLLLALAALVMRWGRRAR